MIEAPNCPLETGLRPCMCDLPRCPKCGYTKHDAAFELHHDGVCDGRIPDTADEREGAAVTAYTDAELLAVARVVWPNCTSSTVLYGRSRDALAYGMLRAAEPQYTGAVEFAVRLALAHPERAGEALGPGWSAYPVGVETRWGGHSHFIDTGCSHRRWMPEARGSAFAIVNWDAALLVLPGRVFQLQQEASEESYEELPPEFDDALSRARLIAAAWQRIEEASRG